ncbi:MAG TPA: hypothetical protein DCY13_03015 [Verrucomicrobiales bacterium]|nr:hypothetical protein [Verrucomicrobiales bacterium]
MPAPNTQLIVFVKAPRPGLVKTRLAAGLGAEQAAAAYRQLVDHLCPALEESANVQLRYDPADAFPEIKHWLRPGWTSEPQDQGGLGARLLGAFEGSAARGFGRTLIIGSDCPWIDGRDLHEAELVLERHDLVLGPAVDGGYWLIGLKQPHPGLFDGIEWSTERVLRQTVAAAERLGLSHELLRTLPDVDTEADWIEFMRRAPIRGPGG